MAVHPHGKIEKVSGRVVLWFYLPGDVRHGWKALFCERYVFPVGLHPNRFEKRIVVKAGSVGIRDIADVGPRENDIPISTGGSDQANEPFWLGAMSVLEEHSGAFGIQELVASRDFEVR